VPLILPKGEFHAYLFDCDGTIADSMPIHLRAWNQALLPWKCEFPEKLFYSWAGIPIKKVIELLSAEFGIPLPIVEIAAAREAVYWNLLPEIRPQKAVLDEIHRCAGLLPMAVVSGSPRESVLKTLTAFKLTEYFQEIICSEDYELGKPSPDCFLLAAQKLGVAPKNCLVFEDAELGIKAATLAGMASIRIK